jgi:DNA invertase Pin-like site-specific DNA recombinase
MAAALLVLLGIHSIGCCQESSSKNYRRRHFFHVRRALSNIAIDAALAEKERRAISQRTRDALAAKKAQGVKLGGLNAKGIANREEALDRSEQLRPVFAELAGMSHRKMAAELNAGKIPTPAGRQWHAVTVKRVLSRLG